MNSSFWFPVLYSEQKSVVNFYAHNKILIDARRYNKIDWLTLVHTTRLIDSSPYNNQNAT